MTCGVVGSLRASKLASTTSRIAALVLAVPVAAGVALDAAQSQTRLALQQPPAATLVKTTIPFEEARPILEALRRDLLPPEMQDKTVDERRRSWPGWIADHDAEIRQRVDRGDDDSLANLLLFGTTFLRGPYDDVVSKADQERTRIPGRDEQGVERRIDAMVAAIASSDDDERLQFARSVVERAGINPATAEGRLETRRYLAAIIQRMTSERDRYEQERTDRPLDFAKQSTLFSDRGLSSDTSMLPNFAIDRTLAAIKAKNALGAATVRRVAVIGPGLDFMNKKGGYDFYPPQMLQPFAVVGSLRRLEFAAADMALITFDLSRRVNRHLELARQRAKAGGAYVMRLARDLDEPWNQELIAYWNQFGDGIGAPASAMVPGGVKNVDARAVRVSPATVLSIVPQDLNIVVERLDAPPAGAVFDLIIGTNVFIYYDVFEQSLALANVSSMLRAGGLFLSNDFLNLLPTIPLNTVGYTDVGYSPTAAGSGDRVFWYQRQ